MMKTRWILPVFMLALFLGSCGPSQAGKAQDPAPLEPQQVPSQAPLPNPSENSLPIPTKQEVPDGSSLPAEKFIDLAKENLARYLKINIEQITLLKSMEMTWPNAALGCPSPGNFYAQGQVPGYRIWLDAGGVEYIYHTDLTGQVMLCPTMNPDESSTSTQGPEIGVPIK